MPDPFSQYLVEMGLQQPAYASAAYEPQDDLPPDDIPGPYDTPFAQPVAPLYNDPNPFIQPGFKPGGIKPPGTQENPRGRAVPGTGGGSRTTAPANAEISNYIRQAAQKRGIDPDIAEEIADREGGRDKFEGNTGQFNTGRSHWAFQLHYGGAGTPYAAYGTTAGMGNDFTERTGYQPGDPNAWRAAVDFALDHAARYGWGAWYGRRANQALGRREIGEFEGITGKDPGMATSAPGAPKAQRFYGR